MTDSTLIKINQYGDKDFVFDAKDMQRLRCEYRIVGALSGTLSQFPLQNTFYGLPLMLIPEEVELITSQGWGQIITKKPFKRQQKHARQFEKNIIFKNFWQLGYYITSGVKFGGNYLLYKDDPMCTHSDFIVSVREEEETLLPLEIIGMGRVATNVKKTFVIAAVKADLTMSHAAVEEEEAVVEEEEEVQEQEEMMTYYSIEWAGF